VITLWVVNDRDEWIWDTTTELEGVSLGTLDAKHRVTFQLRSIPLFEGRYNLSVGIHTRDKKTTYDWHHQRYVFEVVRYLEKGMVVPTEVRVERL
jgi:Wzt-like putative exopolysaccharide export protein